MTYWERFENLCSSIGKKPNPVGKEIGVSSSTITKWKNGAIPNGEILLTVADYFNCSVDYLLCRTGNPITNTSISGNINTGDINNSSNIDMSIGKVGTAEAPVTIDTFTQQLLELVDGLTIIQKAEVIVMISKMKSGE